MADTIDLKKKQEAEHRLALLTLIGQLPEPSGSCLKAEELAALVERRLAPERLEICLAHLAGCDHCYAFWRRLDQDRQQQQQAKGGSRSNLFKLCSRPPFLAAAGSLLAAAASIAVFLTITTRVDHRTLTQLAEKPVQEQRLTLPAEDRSNRVLPEPAAPALAPVSRDAAKEKAAPQQGENRTKALTRQEAMTSPARRAKPAQPEMKAAQKKEKTEAAGAPEVTKTDRLEADQQASLGAVQSVPAVPPPAPQAAAVPPPGAGGGVRSLTYDEWGARIRAGCQERPEAAFFIDIKLQGQRLLAEATGLTTQEQRRVEQILTQLAEQHPMEQQCRSLLQMLDPPTEKDK